MLTRDLTKTPAPTRLKSTTATTRERLLQAAREAFGALGYVATRVDDVVRRAGTSHGTFYTYFKDKKDVLLGLATEVAHSLYGAALAPVPEGELTPRAVVRTRIASFLAVYRRHWDVIRSWTQAEGVHPDVEQAKSRIRRAIVAGVAELLHRDQTRGLLAPNARPDFLATALVAMTEGFANDRFASRTEITDRDLDDLADLWVRAAYRPDLTGG
jgi:AcrR family transcriptional regulator